MARKYELKQRAERQAETRRRIVEAAVHLHGTLGPARTSFSEVARAAGVQRHTLYRHFPDERALFIACSGHVFEANPPPDAEAWRTIADPQARLRRGLTDLYEFYDRVSDMLAAVLRDAEVHPLTREMHALRSRSAFAAIREALSEVLPRRGRAAAVLDLALDFRTWQSLVQRSGLSNTKAAETMVAAIHCR